MDTATKEFLAIELKRKQDARRNYAERAIVAQAVQEFADRSPSGPLSQRVEGTPSSVCERDLRIHSC